MPPCTDVTLPPIPCTNVSSAVRSLCVGIGQLFEASCADLASVPFLTDVITSIGLTNDRRGKWLYGEAAKYMINATGDKYMMGLVGGLWQDPLQLAPALAAIAKK